MISEWLRLFARIPRPTRHIAAVILAQKLVLTVLIFAAPAFLPSLFPTEEIIHRRFRTVDTRYYLQIAAEGYYPQGAECAFYPLWPLVIAITSFVTGLKDIVCAYLLANFASFAGLILFHRFVWEKHDLESAHRATVLLLLFPGSAFFFFPYSESLFLLLLATFLMAAQRKNYLEAGAAAFYLALCRPIGIFILPVLLWELFRRKCPWRNYWTVAGPLLGYLCYFVIIYLFTGNPWEGFEAQSSFPAQPSVAKIFDFPGFGRALMDFGWSHDMLHSLVDRFCFLVLLGSLYWCFRQDRGYLLYAVLAGVVPALSNSLMSYTRFLAMVLPLFIVLGRPSLDRTLFWLMAVLFSVAQLCFFLRHISGRWAG